ncbi:MAG TPA: class I SAM-dependent methyltransferase [Candidatus Omnitrophota bacterium]|nr:class I SAM-dependent methyltransferase [Candidatus Omnitrophota bacterium]HPD84874.1 class I SAM-dependent methyltransferase [Candidatus Omnitrophota bacterium]HRZ03732.1 class I SAM-dependent methyltransferase [Candidatus Omnitrophota bacterium]
MDLRAPAAGLSKDYFWYKSKLDLIRILFDRVSGKEDIPAQRKILNIGVGTGDDLALMQTYGKVFAIDSEAKAVESLSPNACYEKKVSSACAIDYPDGYFDIVTAFDVLEYIEDHALAVREIRRVLKPGGIFLFTVPALPWLYSAHDRFYGHVRRYSKGLVKNILSVMQCRRLGYWMFFLFLPIAGAKLFNKKGSRLVYAPLPRFINAILYAVCRLETFFIRNNFPIPFGITIFGVYEKT